MYMWVIQRKVVGRGCVDDDYAVTALTLVEYTHMYVMVIASYMQ